MSKKRWVQFLFCLTAVIGFSATAASGADILFISAMDGAEAGADDDLKAFMEGLGHTVTYFDDDESEADTEIAAAAADLVFISESVGSGGIREEITEVEVPMIVNEMWGWDEMGLTHGGGADENTVTTDIEIVNPDHYLAAGLSGSIALITDLTGTLGECHLGKGIAGDEATVIATASLADGETYDVIFVYEKGAALPVAPTDGSAQIAADVRVCFGFHEFCDPLLSDDAYALLEAAISYALGVTPLARNPRPQDGSMHEDTWATLSWSPGAYAVTSDVYLGDNYDDVNDGVPETFQGNQADTSLIIGFPGFAYPEGLVPGTTYYWRIDGINEADPNSPWKGTVWSFSIPPKTAYGPDPADGAEFVDPNADLIWTAGFGTKLHTIYLGNVFADVNDATEGVPSGKPSYDPGTLELEKVYYWRIDQFDGLDTYKGGVWSFTTPGAVGNPQPANGAVDVQITATLGWNPADSAASHDLYFGTDKNAVENAAANSPEYIGNKTLGSESYDPGKLDWFSTYHWRVDAVYAADTVKGLVWSFTTADFILVDDFESYNDVDPPDPASYRIFEAWIDGFGTTDNGALVGNDLPPYTEQVIVHGGAQSMPYSYDNNLKTSEATLTLVSPRDWTVEGVAKLSLWFRGDYDNAPERMFVALNGTAVVYHADPAVTQIAKWTEWVIDLQEFAGQGVNLANVNTITIGFGTKNSPAAGGSGKMLFDDIRLYR
ncbi:MAG: hypothetical protein ACYSWW_20175 [Planctomycetota bacterium]|jgi:hypothetical protein